MTRFPADFVWGAATASYQIEGAAGEDGRGESIWDRFSATPGRVRNGDSGAIACDFYHRYPDDIALMRELGLDAFRFSVAWPRVLPVGVGAVNEAGLDFYDRLVDALLASGIRPCVTLYHWDLPQALEEQGGWTSRATVDAFAGYVEAVVGRLGDRVARWITHNEPWVAAWLGYGWGMHAPGRASEADALAAAHHLLLSHGRAVEVLRRDAPGAEVGITLNLMHDYPASAAPEDVAAARHVDGFRNRWFLDPVFRGEYPADLLADTGGLEWQGRPWPTVVQDGDLDLISTPLDALGVNYYKGDAVSGRAHPMVTGVDAPHASRPTSTPFVGCEDVTFPSRGLPVTAMGWEVQPEGLTRLLTRLAGEYDVPPMYLTENGAAYVDERSPDGQVHDPERTAYLADHLRTVHAAIEQGADVRGYFYWSLMDNFEWAYGYAKRFGIVFVDYDSLERVPKDSAWWYSRVASSNTVGSVP